MEQLLVDSSDKVLPSNYSRELGLKLFENHVEFRGYQEFVLGDGLIEPLEDELKVKKNLLDFYFKPRFMEKKEFLDLGANAGFFSFWALQNKAKKATSVDLDRNYLSKINDASSHLGILNINTVCQNIENCLEVGDVVLALSLIHWIYSCSSNFGSLDTVISKLAIMANEMLIIEWIEPNDPAIIELNHIEWNKDCITESYNRENFVRALDANFAHHEVVANTKDTRVIYVAYKNNSEIDLSIPLKSIIDQRYIISSVNLGTVGGVPYYSRVYDFEGFIYKQGSFRLASREEGFLSVLRGDYFPHCVGVEQYDDYSVVKLEKILGVSLKSMASKLKESFEGEFNFVWHCLNILENLANAGITHRDIHIGNFIIRNESPVLIDFGWAVRKDEDIVAPSGLHQEPSGGSCDVYSMGKVFEKVCINPEIISFIKLMTNPDRGMRLRDIPSLKSVFIAMSKLKNIPSFEGEELEELNPFLVGCMLKMSNSVFEMDVKMKKLFKTHEKNCCTYEKKLDGLNQKIIDITNIHAELKNSKAVKLANKVKKIIGRT
ncbi:hypothetical protein N8865_01410 [Francisellaceae bacterium]|nr:hypothetical protein [Francisellaceae bacterium]